MTSPPLTSTETALVDTVRVALTSSPSALRQFARRMAKNPPTDVNKVELQAQLSALLASAPPDSASTLRRSQPADGLPAPLPPQSAAASSTKSLGSGRRERGGAVKIANDGRSGNAISSPGRREVRRRPVLPPTTGIAIDELIRQRSRAALLAKHGLSPASKVLFVGPPGVGKTMTAAFLASELDLPLVVVDPTVVISSYLGGSAKNLRDLLDRARDEECVVFFDEFDALAKSRDDASDIGEVKRLVNSLLLELDRSRHSLVIAATNFDEILDTAIIRRFDTRIEFPLPGPAERCKIIEQHPALKSLGAEQSLVTLLALATHGWSPSDIDRHLNAVTRSAVLKSDGDDSGVSPLQEIAEWGVSELNRPGADPGTRHEIAAVAVNVMDYSHRQAAELLGVSHPTISKWLQKK